MLLAPAGAAAPGRPAVGGHVSGPGFGVISPELLTAASDIDEAVAPVSCYHLPVATASGDSVGHVELAATLSSFSQALDKTVVALAGQASSTAANLRSSSSAYNQGDLSSVLRLSPLEQRLGGSPAQ